MYNYIQKKTNSIRDGDKFMKYKGVVFDLDGTLLNTIDDLADSMNEVLRRRGYPTHEVEKYRYFVGNGIANLVRRALPQWLKDEDIKVECVHSMKEEYNKRMTDKTHPYEGIPELLDELTLRGVKIAILSNKPDPATKLVTAELLSRWKFQSVLGERPDVPRKPDPAGAFETAKKLEIMPEEILYVGDSGVDMETALNAGMFGVGAAWGFRTVEELESSGAKAVIHNPLELLGYL